MKIDILFENESARREEALVKNAVQATKEDIGHSLKHYVTAYNYWVNNKDEVPDQISQLSGILRGILITLHQADVPIDIII